LHRDASGGEDVTRFVACWIGLLLNAVAILAFGMIAFALPGAPEPFSRSIGAASIGMGLFGAALTLTAFRARERWSWIASWYYAVFWAAHLGFDLPPGQDHVHQVAGIAITALALLFSRRDFFATSLAA
jgi:hypothetical protein